MDGPQLDLDAAGIGVLVPARPRPAIPGRRQPAALGKHGNSVGTEPPQLEGVEAAKALRRKAFDLLDLAGLITRNTALQHCHRTRIPKKAGPAAFAVPGEVANIQLRRKAGVPYVGGVQKCGSVWLCPVCATRIAGERRREIERVSTLHLERGGSVAFLTLTSVHKIEYNQTKFRRAVTEAFRALQQSRMYRRMKRTYQVAGHLRKLEVNYGPNGFHVHLHVALFFDRDFTPRTWPAGHPQAGKWREPAEISVMEKILYTEWRKALTDLGYPPPSRKRGALLEYVKPGTTKWRNYLAKMGFEFTGQKQGRHKNRSMFQVLEDAGLTFRRYLADGYSPVHVNHSTGEVVHLIADVKVWRLYEKVIKGARQLEWSRALKKRYAVQDPPDEQLAVELPGGEDDELLLDIPKWSRVWHLIQEQPNGMAQVISAAGEGMEGLWDLFLEWGWTRRTLKGCLWGDEYAEQRYRDRDAAARWLEESRRQGLEARQRAQEVGRREAEPPGEGYPDPQGGGWLDIWEGQVA